MNKLPVGRTIASAYRFTFVSLDKVIALIWLPIIVMTVGDYFINGAGFAAKAAVLDSGDALQAGPVMAAQFAFAFVKLLLEGVIAVAICREILNPLQRSQWFRFSLGGTEFRFVGGMLALVALIALAFMVCIIMGMVVSGVMPAMGKAMAPGQMALGVAVLIGLLFSPLIFYVFIRLGSLILPGVVMDGGLGLEKSWVLLKGNVFRMFVVSLAVGLPVILVFLGLYAAILGPDFFNPHVELLGDPAAQARHSAELMRRTAERLPLLEGLQFVMAPFLFGLSFSAPAFAYKSLTETTSA